jgi:hypothetical protein
MFPRKVTSGLAVMLVSVFVFASPKESGESPHAAALDLLFKQDAEQIRNVDKENWWFDTKERVWAVKRPFSPSTIDSRHSFVVRYCIDGKEVAEWFVDTKRGKVNRVIKSQGQRAGKDDTSNDN